MTTRTKHSRSTWSVRSGQDRGRAIAEIRRDRGLTQHQLAESIQLDRAYLAGVETGRSVRTIDHVLRALRHLGAEVTITWLPDEPS